MKDISGIAYMVLQHNNKLKEFHMDIKLQYLILYIK